MNAQQEKQLIGLTMRETMNREIVDGLLRQNRIIIEDVMSNVPIFIIQLLILLD